MANPLAVFRKYQKILLVVFGVALMLVFTVGEIISQYMYRGDQASENRVVVAVDSNELRESDVQSLQFARYHLRNFMRAVNLYAAQKGATPQQGLGISDTDAEADLVQTAILARQAQKMGMVVSDDAIINYLTRYSQGKLAPGDFARILREVTQGRMSQNQFFDAMRRELMAQQYLGVQQEGMMPPTPAAMWEYFLQLNRQLSFEAVPFEVQDYLSQVEEPTEAQIAALFEEGKDQYPFPDRPDVGFKQLKRVAIEYVKADLTPFLDEAMAQITDDEVLAYYEANKEEFRNFDLPGLNDPLFGGELNAIPGAESTPQESPEAEVSAGEVPQSEASQDAATDPAAPQSELPQDEPPRDGIPFDLPLDLPEQSVPQDALPESGLNRSMRPESDLIASGAFTTREVAAQQPDAPVDSVEAVEVDAAATDASSSSPEVPEGAAPAESSVENSPPAPADSAVTPEETPAETPAESESEQPAEQPELPADEVDPLLDLPEAAGNNVGDVRPEYQSLEEAASTIRARLAAPIARERMEKALNQLNSEMKAYFGNYLAWDVSPDRNSVPPPTRPDLRTLAQQQGLTAGATELITMFQLQENDPVTGEPLYEISRAYDTNLVPFRQYMFSNDLRPFEVRSIRGQLLDTEYLFWKTDELAERVPELQDVRDEVVHRLKMRQALELAKKDAQNAAEQLNQTNRRPQDVYANDPNRKVINADRVSWMSSTSVPYLPPRLTQIPGIQYAGDDFMNSVFSLRPGQAGTAVDHPQDTVYVVYVNSLDSDEEQLRQQFLRSGATAETAQLAQRDAQRHLQQWYESLEKDLNVKWQRDPNPDSRAR